jgi:ABC-type dipeptide/oligopeptide/nickel transport system permease subunit
MSITQTPEPVDIAQETLRRRIRVPAGFRSPLAVIGAVILALWVLVIIFAPLIAPYSPLETVGPRLQAPGGDFLLGTDTIGRDVLSRVIHGSRVSLPTAILVVFVSMVIGSIIGAVAGFFGGWIDEVLMRLADLVFAFPTVILAMVVAAALGPSLSNAVIAILVVAWPQYARVARSLVLSARESEYVVSSRLLGFGPVRSLRVDILPNVMSPVVVLATLDIGTAMLLLSGLSFLGLGSVPPTPEWGAIISEGTKFFDAWWISTAAGVAIFTVVLACNFLGDALRDTLDPRTAESVEGTAL